MTSRKGRPISRTAKDWIDNIVSAKTAEKIGLIRRKRTSIPYHLSLKDVIEEACSRKYKVLMNDSQIIFILDRRLQIVS